MLPDGLIFKLARRSSTALPPRHRSRPPYWDAYAAQLLADPTFRVDDDATITFGKLAFNHADLYRWRNLTRTRKFPQARHPAQPAIAGRHQRLQDVYLDQHRYDEAMALLARRSRRSAQRRLCRPHRRRTSRQKAAQEKTLRAELATAPNDLAATLQLVKRVAGGGQDDRGDRPAQMAAAFPNWTHDQMADLVEYFIGEAHDLPAVIAFLRERVKYDHDSKLVYSLAALEGSLGGANDAVHDLATAALAPDGTNALISAAVDTRFAPIKHDPRFQTLLGASSNAATAVKAARQVLAQTNLAPVPTNAPPAAAPVPHRMKRALAK